MSNPYRVGFTGHRDKLADGQELRLLLGSLLEEHQDMEAWHGGAVGFDTQVDSACRQIGIPTVVVRPDYKRHPPKVAPHVRNRLIVDSVEMVVGLHDGRCRGGTFETLKYAKVKGKPTTVLAPRRNVHECRPTWEG